jgi:hypothetical protein
VAEIARKKLSSGSPQPTMVTKVLPTFWPEKRVPSRSVEQEAEQGQQDDELEHGVSP